MTYLDGRAEDSFLESPRASSSSCRSVRRRQIVSGELFLGKPLQARSKKTDRA